MNRHSAQSICAILAGYRFPITTEVQLQLAMHDALLAAEIDTVRELELSKGNRIDLFVRSAGVGIECKIKGSKREIFRQVERYCGHELIEAMILATNVAIGMPAEIKGKPVLVLNLSRAWL